MIRIIQNTFSRTLPGTNGVKSGAFEEKHKNKIYVIPKTSHINRLLFFQRTAWICLLSIIAVFCLLSPAHADISRLDGSWHTGLTGYTVPAGSDRLLVFVTGFTDNGPVEIDVSAVTYGGVSMSPGEEHVNLDATRVIRSEIWYLKEADIPAGSNNFIVTYTGGAPPPDRGDSHAAATYSNVDQTTPIYATNKALTTGNPVSTTVDVVQGGMSISGAVARSTGSYDWTGGDLIETTDQAPGTYHTTGTAEHAAATAGTDNASASYSGGSVAQVIVAVSLNPAATNSAPAAPTTPYCDNTTAQSAQASPATGITDPTPAFSAIYNDPDSGDIANKYRVEVNTASNFGGTVMWDSGSSGTSMTNTSEGNRCPDIIYAGTALSSSTTYYWRITFWDDDDTQGTVSATQNFTTGTLQTVTALYRSVGTTGSDLNTDVDCTVDISGSTATFNSDGACVMPDNIGVGDAVVYNTDGAIAFIHARTSAKIFTVKNKDGDTPVSTSGSVAAKIFRCYTALADWQSQTENATIPAAVDQDVNPSKDLATADTIMMVACYGDGPDSTVTITDWTTDADNYVKIYTPVSSSEVGVSQRHNGTWDDSKYRIEAAGGAPLRIGQNGTGVEYLTIEGLQIYLSAVNGNGNAGILLWQTSVADHRISNNIIKSVTHASYVYSGIYNYILPSGSEVRIWNNIIYGFDGPQGKGIYNIDADTTAYVYNNTIYNCYVGCTAIGPTVAKNNISMCDVVNSSFTDFTEGGAGFSSASTHNYSSDTSAPDNGGANPSYENKTLNDVDFVSTTAGSENLHLQSTSDAIDVGTDQVSEIGFTDDIDAGAGTSVRSGSCPTLSNDHTMMTAAGR